MARLDKSYRMKLGHKLREQLPSHWSVLVGVEGHAFIEVDQDSKRGDDDPPAIGSTVVVIENNPQNGTILANVYHRVDPPEGYLEDRVYDGTLVEVSGQGWSDVLIDAVVPFTVELEACMWGNTLVAEA